MIKDQKSVNKISFPRFKSIVFGYLFNNSAFASEYQTGWFRILSFFEGSPHVDIPLLCYME